MNPLLNPIFKRKSIRQYKTQDINDTTVRDLLDAAMAAPSAVACDPWEFIVIRDKEILAHIAEELPNGKMLAAAPLGIIICGDIKRAHAQLQSYMLQDCSAAIQNLLLAASMLGLGACWLGVHPREERIKHIKKIFNLPENIIPIAAIAVGHPGEEKQPGTRYNPAHVHYDKFT